MARVNLSFFHTVPSPQTTVFRKSHQKHNHCFYGISPFFRQIDDLTKEELISRKFLIVIAFYSIFPHYYAFFTNQQNFREINAFSTKLQSMLFSRKFSSENEIPWFLTFHNAQSVRNISYFWFHDYYYVPRHVQVCLVWWFVKRNNSYLSAW